jgi:hypothetical protein
MGMPGEINNGEPPVAQPYSVIDIKTGVIRPSVNKAGGHPLQKLFTDTIPVKIHLACESTHISLPVLRPY